MADMNRRRFIQRSAQGAAAAWAAMGLTATPRLVRAEGAALPAAPKASALRPLGKTGLKTSLLGMGTGTRAWAGSSAQNRRGRDAFVGTLVHAYERGLRYYDLADMYGAHNYMKDAMAQAKMPREDLLLLTKSTAKTAEGMKSDVERFMKEIDTDYLDVVLLHCMTDPNWTEKMQGCMDVLSEYKAQGKVRAVGVSCHNFMALKRAAAHPWVEIMLSRINPFGVKMDASPEEVAPVLQEAHDAGKGMLGMKILGEGSRAEGMAESLKYVLGLGCIDAMTVGFVRPEEVDELMKGIEAAA